MHTCRKCAIWVAIILLSQVALLAGVSMASDTDSAVIDKWIKDNNLKWLKGLKFSADFRLRHQYENWEYINSDGDEADNERHRGRLRVRFGFTKKFEEDDLEVGFRLASGSSDDPTSTNQTLEKYHNKKAVWIDLGYAK